MILAWMGYTEDLIGGKFSIPGGSATMSDGKYFWRYEAGMYLRHYPIRVPDEEELAKTINEDFEKAVAESKKVTIEEVRNMSKIKKYTARILKLLAPLM